MTKERSKRVKKEIDENVIAFEITDWELFLKMALLTGPNLALTIPSCQNPGRTQPHRLIPSGPGGELGWM